jgi:phage shock protein A
MQAWARKKKEWEETLKIEDQMRDLQRKFQHDQLELQLAQIGNQVEQAKRQKEINDAMVKTQQTWSDMMGEINNMSTYTAAFNALQAARYLLEAADNTSTAPIDGLRTIFNTIERLAARPDVLKLLNDIFKEIAD